MKTKDGSIINHEGNFIFVSIERFVQEICLGENCFLCSKPIEEGSNSREHILPDWVLRNYDLHNHRITLPNGSSFKYGEYVVPCCVNCNGLLGKHLEDPIKKAFEGGIKGVESFLAKEGIQSILVWLALIFIKTHLKDQALRMNLDRQESGESIAESLGHEWETFHHIYSISRSPYTKAKIDGYAIGSWVMVQLTECDSAKEFDFIDISSAHTVGVAIGDIGIIAVFGDAGAVKVAIQELILDKIAWALSPPQLRELVAHFACCSLHMKNYPKFMTLTDINSDEEVQIVTKLHESGPEFESPDARILGGIMDMLLGDLMEGKVERKGFREDLLKGELSFLFDSEGTFIER